MLTGDALLVGDAGRPDLHAHGEQTRRGDGAHAVPLADRAAAGAARPPAALPGALLGLGLRPRAVGATRPRRSASSAATTPRCSFDSEDAFVAALLERHPAGARAAGRDRRRQPRRARRSPTSRERRGRVQLGLRENLAQFSLLVAINAFVGAMVGLERSTLPLDRPRRLRARPRAPRCCRSSSPSGSPRRSPTSAPARSPQRVGRRRLLIAGWALALPVPLLIARRAELGLDRRRQRPARRQPGPGLVDDRGDEDRPRRPEAPRPRARAQRGRRLRRRRARRRAQRLARRRVRRPRRARRRRRGRSRSIALAALACCSSATPPRTSRSSRPPPPRRRRPPAAAARGVRATRPTACRRCAPARRPASSTTSTTRLAWGLVPLFLAAHGAGVADDRARRRRSIPASGASAQIATGHWSDTRRAQAADRRRHARPGRRARRCSRSATARVAVAAVGRGRCSALGTALVYPTLIAAISDAVSPVARAPVVGVYRFWRDMGYVARRPDRRRRRRRARLRRRDRARRRRSPPRPGSGCSSTCP